MLYTVWAEWRNVYVLHKAGPTLPRLADDRRHRRVAELIRQYEISRGGAHSATNVGGHSWSRRPDLHALRVIRLGARRSAFSGAARSSGFSTVPHAALLELRGEAPYVDTCRRSDRDDRRSATLRGTLARLRQCHGDERPECPILDDLGGHDAQGTPLMNDAASGTTRTDPVCGMTVAPIPSASEHDGADYDFCCASAGEVPRRSAKYLPSRRRRRRRRRPGCGDLHLPDASRDAAGPSRRTARSAAWRSSPRCRRSTRTRTPSSSISGGASGGRCR